MKTIDCKSEEGITISMIASIMALANLIRYRNLLVHPDILEAIKDLQDDKDLTYLLTFRK